MIQGFAPRATRIALRGRRCFGAGGHKWDYKCNYPGLHFGLPHYTPPRGILAPWLGPDMRSSSWQGGSMTMATIELLLFLAICPELYRMLYYESPWHDGRYDEYF